MNWWYEHYASSQGRNKLFLSCSLGLHTVRHIFTFKTWRKGKATPIFKYETFTFIRIWSGIWKKHVRNKWFIHVVWIKFFTSFFLATCISCSNITWQMDWRLHVQATFILVVKWSIFSIISLKNWKIQSVANSEFVYLGCLKYINGTQRLISTHAFKVSCFYCTSNLIASW